MDNVWIAPVLCVFVFIALAQAFAGKQQAKRQIGQIERMNKWMDALNERQSALDKWDNSLKSLESARSQNDKA